MRRGGGEGGDFYLSCFCSGGCVLLNHFSFSKLPTAARRKNQIIIFSQTTTATFDKTLKYLSALESTFTASFLLRCQEYEFKRDKADKNPPLSAVLRPNVNLRPYQQRALAKMFSVQELF